MQCGFQVVYGYTESDEISLLFSLDESVFGRKIRKYNSILAGEASAKFSLLLGDLGAFDCRISQLPQKVDVVDYFRWRNEDANRNALNAHCYWMLRNTGESSKSATRRMKGLTVAEKNELLFVAGLNFNDLPNWQKRGVDLYWKSYQKQGQNPKTGEKVMASKRDIFVDYDLPMRDEYNDFIGKLILKNSSQE